MKTLNEPLNRREFLKCTTQATANETGKNQLYVYRLDDGSTRRVSTNALADYRYPHGEAAPC